MTGYTEAQAIGDVAEQIRFLAQSFDAIAYEQHTANLLQALSMFDPEGRAYVTDKDRRTLDAEVRNRLGLAS